MDGSADGEKGLGSRDILKIGPEYLLKNEIYDLKEKEEPWVTLMFSACTHGRLGL